MSESARYSVRHPVASDLPALEHFAISVIARHRVGEISRRWWWRGDRSACWLAIDASSGEIAACCAARSGHLLVDDVELPAAGVCDWYVSPYHRGVGLGRLLVERVRSQRHALFAASISESAAAGFARLGWTGPERLPVLVGQPALIAALGVCRRQLNVRSFAPANAPWPDLDAIWMASDRSALPVMAPRDSRRVREHIAIAGTRRLRLAVASIADRPMGYALYRALPTGAIRRFSWARAGMLVDFWVAGDDVERRAVLGALAARAAGEVAASGALAFVALVTQRWAIDGLERAGFASPRTPVIGSALGRLSNRAMHNGDGLPSFEKWHLTFADGDTDLLLGA